MRYIGLFFRLAGVVIGVVLIAIGLPLLVTPIPVGAVLIVLGLVVLIASSAQVRGWVRAQRERYPQFDARLRKMEDGLPGMLRALLTGTRPHREG